MNKILTVVIPTYNMEKYLRKCLNSLIIDDKDLLKSLEVLVINDGSQDSSSVIAHEYEQSYPEIFRVIDKENGNYGSCINRGLREATGKYIKILDADDSFDTKNFSVLLKNMASIDVDMFISDFSVVSGKDTIKEMKHFSFPKNQIFDIKQYIATYSKIDDISMHAIAYKTDNLRNSNYSQTEGISYTDQEWTYLLIYTVSSVYYLGSCVYKYLVGRQGQTIDFDMVKKNFNDRVIITQKIIRFYNKHISNNQYAAYNDFLLKCLLVCIRGLYLFYLFINRDAKGAILFDAFLQKESPGLYISSLDIYMHPYVKYKFIRKWRKTQKLPNVCIAEIYKLLKKIRHLIYTR